jgi:hypothetical protein
MSVMTWTYLIVGLGFALYIGIAIRSKVGTRGTAMSRAAALPRC